MPFSHNRFDHIVRAIMEFTQYQWWHDFGVGSGKYGKMLQDTIEDVKSVAVEISRDYVEKYSLEQKYKHVYRGCIIEYSKNFIPTDAIIMGDILEHLPKSDGIDLVNRLVYKCKMMIIIYPIGRIQEAVNGNPHEEHISVWGKSDWLNFGHQIIEHEKSHLVVIDGYIDHERIDLHDIAELD